MVAGDLMRRAMLNGARVLLAGTYCGHGGARHQALRALLGRGGDLPPFNIQRCTGRPASCIQPAPAPLVRAAASRAAGYGLRAPLEVVRAPRSSP